MAQRGMPEHARKLTELLEEKQSWNKEVSHLFRSARDVFTPTSSQTDFAMALGISQGYLSQIENGVRTPSSETLNKLQSIVEGEGNASADQAEAAEAGDEA